MISSVSSSIARNSGWGSSYRTLSAEQEQLSRTEESAPANGKEKSTPDNPHGLSPAELDQVERLEQRDAEVRAHEMAHMAAAGGLARGGPSYVFQTGPDGKNYAIGGSVKIDTSPGSTPEETERKAALIRSSALASHDASPQDLKVAASAASMASDSQQARSEASNSKSTSPASSKFQQAIAAYGAASQNSESEPGAFLQSNA